VLSAIIATLGLNVVLNSVAGLIWGHQTYTFPSPFAFSPPFLIGGVPVSVDSVVNIAVGLVLIISMTLFLRYTWTGLSLRAASQNQTVARLMGVSITRSSAIAWGLGGLVGGIAGILVAPSLFLDTNLMSALLIKAFAGGVLGGLNSLIGVFLGCLALGVAIGLLFTLPRIARRFGWTYAVFTAGVLLLPIIGTKDFMGTGRYLLVAFPVFALVGEWLADRPRLRPAVLVVSGSTLLFLTTLFARGHYLA
jgi:branched-chain amino acid transport system permease protein